MSTPIFEILVRARDEATQVLEHVQKVGRDTGSVFEGVGGALKTAGAAAGGALLVVGAAAAKAAIDFQTSMANVQTLIGPGSDSEARIAALGADVKNMAVETGKDLGDLSGGLYQVISAFGNTADTSKILESAAKASTAGLASTTDAINLLSAVTKGYGDTSVGAVGKVSDLAFQTVKLGQTTFPELAASMGQAVPLASALGVHMEELFGAEATLTGVTGNTAEVTTQLRGAFQALIQSNPDMLAGLEKIGYKSGSAAVEALGFGGTINALSDAVDGNAGKLGKMFGSVEALNAVLALTGPQADSFAEKTKAMGDATGETQKAFEIQEKTVGATFGRIWQSIQVLLVNLGDKFLPGIQSVLDTVVTAWPQISAVFDQVFTVVGNVVGTISGLFDTFRDKAAGVGAAGLDLGGVISQVGAVFDWLVTNVGPPVSGFLEILGLAFDTVVGVVRDNWPTIQSIVNRVAAAVKAAVEAMSAIFKTVYPIIHQIAEVLFPALGKAAGVLLHVIDGAFKLIGDVWNGLWDVAKTVAGAVGGILGGLGDAFRGFARIVGAVWDGITGGIKGGINFVIDLVNGFIRTINGIQIHIPGIDTPFGKVASFDWGGLNLRYIPHLDVGAWRLLEDTLAMLHQDEMVVPAGPANALRAALAGPLSSSPGLGGGYTYAPQFHLHAEGVVEAKDEETVLRALQRMEALAG